MNFWETSKKGWGVVFNPKIDVADLRPLQRFFSDVFRKKLQYDFQKGGGGIEGRLDFLRKFIRFGSVTLPLPVQGQLSLPQIRVKFVKSESKFKYLASDQDSEILIF